MQQKNIIIDLILILITGGLWNIWMQYRQIRDYNNINRTKNYSFFKWFIFTLVTFGIYHVYHEYKLTRDIYLLTGNTDNAEIVGLIAGAISITGLWIFVDLYQQELLNRRINAEYI
jgi:hypothetical protein